MQKRPVLLFFASCLFLYFPLELVFEVIRQKHVKPADWLLSGVLPIILLTGLIRVSKIGWYTLIALVSLWGMKDLYAYYSDDKSLLPFISHLLIYGFSMTYFINPRIRHLYFDPKSRWWRSKPRYETHHAVMLNHQESAYYPIIRNISEGGCFLEMGEKLGMLDQVDIVFPLPVPLGKSVFRSKGEVRWVSSSTERPGLGIQFKEMATSDQNALNQFVMKQL